MRAAKPAIALDPRVFGRRTLVHETGPASPPTLGADARLFATTFLAGFVFVSVLLA